MIKNFNIDDKHEDNTGTFNNCSLFVSLSTCVKFGMTNGKWLDCVEKMGKWYETNIHTYQGCTGPGSKGKHWYDCSLVNTKVADDCSGFVQACLLLFGVKCPSISTAVMQNDGFMKMMTDAGFEHISGKWTIENAKPGDILCGRGGTHTEIYAGEKESWSWGNVHDKIGPRSHGQGMPCKFCQIDSRGGYVHCWRYTG